MPTARPTTAHFAAVFAAAAHEAQLEHVVTLSQWLSAPDHLASTTREAWLLDRLIAALPETSHTINDMGFFADNYFSGLAATAQLGKLTMPLGPPELKGNAPPPTKTSQPSPSHAWPIRQPTRDADTGPPARSC